MPSASPTRIASPEETLLKLNLSLADGRRLAADAAPGYHLVELIRASGLPIKAECGGAGACATCHVRVADPWRDLLPEPSEDEVAKLDEIPSADDSSRLACQIVMRKELDGLALELQADSLLRPALQAAE